jgi:hypothetical protein
MLKKTLKITHLIIIEGKKLKKKTIYLISIDHKLKCQCEDNSILIFNQ